MASRDDSARSGRYDDEVKVLTTKISFLEEEVAALRGRLADSPRQARLLEERLRHLRAAGVLDADEEDASHTPRVWRSARTASGTNR